jgi:hypothetical protein
MKLSEFYTSCKRMGTEIAKMAKADVFEITQEQRDYMIQQLEEFTGLIRRADRLCRVLSDDPAFDTHETPSVTNVTTNNMLDKEDKSEGELDKPTEADEAQFAEMSGRILSRAADRAEEK